MNNVKKEIDDFIGDSPRFTRPLRNKILNEVSTLGKKNPKYNVFNKLKLSLLFIILMTVSVSFIVSIITNSNSDNQASITITDSNTSSEIPFINDIGENMTVFDYGYDGMERGNREFSAFPIVIDSLAYKIKDISRGEVIVYEDIFFNGSKGNVVSRIIGLPGENIELKEGQIYINNKLLETFYGKAHVRGYDSFENYYAVLEQNNAKFDAEVIKQIFTINMDEITIGIDEYLVATDDWLRGEQKVIKQNEIKGQVIGYQKK